MEAKTQSPPKHGPRPVDVDVDAEPCTLRHEINFKGTIEAIEDLTILGRVDGKILAKGALIIGKEANANVEGKRILVLGRVKGNLRGSERIELGPTSTVIGDVAAPLIQITEGAQFEGRVHRPGKTETGSVMERLLGR
jgi:cytoskeletal protein CcmA (bactofilin family)